MTLIIILLNSENAMEVTKLAKDLNILTTLTTALKDKDDIISHFLIKVHTEA